MRILAAAAFLLLTTPAFAEGEAAGEAENTDSADEQKESPPPAAEEAPVEEAAAEEAPAEEAAAEEAPAEEAAAEEAPAEEAAAEEAPAEEAAAEEPPAEKAAASSGARAPDVLAGREVGHVADGITAEPMPQVIARDGDTCTFEDLKGEFTLSLPCDLLADHTGHSQPLKRIWLGAPEGQLNMIEVPEPYRTVELDVVMGNLGRFWTKRNTPERAHETTLGGLEARVVTERKLRTLTRHWLFNLNGRNVTLKIAAYEGTHDARTAWLAKASEAVESGLKFK